jgi:regulator of cell morphogenesis and NO signaling
MTFAARTLGDLVAEAPARAAVLDRLGVDYCCHGQRSLADACAADGLDVAAVAAALDIDVPAAVDHPTEPAALADHIESTHHAYLHRELPELRALAAKVDSVHGSRHPELAKVRVLLDQLAGELGPHLAKEERVLFPVIRALARDTKAQFSFGAVDNPIRMMAVEHDRAGELLADLRETTGSFDVPADGCASYRSLYERLAELEADTHRHIHLENNVLFPAAAALGAA